jgi:hypothetical protein
VVAVVAATEAAAAVVSTAEVEAAGTVVAEEVGAAAEAGAEEECALPRSAVECARPLSLVAESTLPWLQCAQPRSGPARASDIFGFHHGFHHRRVFFVGDGSYAYDAARLAGSSRPSLRMNIAQRKGPPVHARRVFLVGLFRVAASSGPIPKAPGSAGGYLPSTSFPSNSHAVLAHYDVVVQATLSGLAMSMMDLVIWRRPAKASGQ